MYCSQTMVFKLEKIVLDAVYITSRPEVFNEAVEAIFDYQNFYKEISLVKLSVSETVFNSFFLFFYFFYFNYKQRYIMRSFILIINEGNSVKKKVWYWWLVFYKISCFYFVFYIKIFWIEILNVIIFFFKHGPEFSQLL